MLKLSHKSLITTNRTQIKHNDQLKLRSIDDQYELCNTYMIKTGEQRFNQAQVSQLQLQFHQIKAM